MAANDYDVSLLIQEHKEDKSYYSEGIQTVEEQFLASLDNVPVSLHNNVSGEIISITEKEELTDDDVFLIEDSEGGYAKKRVKFQSLFISSNLVHLNVEGEIANLEEKDVPVAGDYILIEDSENGYVKKKIQIGNLP